MTFTLRDATMIALTGTAPVCVRTAQTYFKFTLMDKIVMSMIVLIGLVNGILRFGLKNGNRS